MPPPSYTLYTPAGSFRAFAPLIAAEINHVEVSVETENMETIAQEKSPTGQVPLLERNNSNTSSTAKTASAASQKHKGDVIFTSASIARYIAGLRTDTYLMGSSWLEEASINQWVDWCGAELEVPSCLLFYPIAGFMTLNDPEIIRKAETDFSKALQILQDTLSQSKEKCKQNEERDDDCHDYFLMGPHLTLADIFIVSTLIYPFQMAFDRDYLVLQSFDTVVEWFEKCVRRSEFCAVLGTVEIGSKKTTSNREGAAMPPIPLS